MQLRVGVVALVAAALLVPPAAATPPGRNGMIIWAQATSSETTRLFVANPDGSGARQVFATAGNRSDFEAAFSPTNPRLTFFTRSSPAPFSEDIYRGDLATGKVTRVTRSNSADIAPTVSPDGRKIAFDGIPRPRRIDPDVPPPPGRIRVANVDGSGDRALTPAGRDSFDPDWAPDGRRIVYSEARSVGEDDALELRIVVMNADGTGRRGVTPFSRTELINPKWMPDGRTIVLERRSERGTRSDILAINASGGLPRAILATSAWETNPVPSPDGARIVFTSDRDRRGPERLGPGFEVYTMALDGSGIVRLTNNRRPDVFPDWQRLP